MSDITQYDKEEINRCPILGGTRVDFKYCRTLDNGLPCRRTIGCWAPRIAIAPFLKAHYPAETLQEIFLKPRKDKVTEFIDIVKKTRNDLDKSS